MYSVCILENNRRFRRAKFYQYPMEGSSLCKKIICNATKSEQLYIKREDDKLHYVYSQALDDGNIIGLYFESAYLCNDVNDLLRTFRSLVVKLATNQLGVITIDNKRLADGDSISKRRVDFDIFFSETKISFRGTRLPVANIGVSKDDVVRCVYSQKGSDWILTQIKNGYHQVEVTCNDAKITESVRYLSNTFYWGWKTWILFMFLISVLVIVFYTIYDNPVLQAHFKYEIDNLIG